MNIFHLTTQKEWEKAKITGIYIPTSLNKEGFIHCCNKNQILSLANYYFKGRKDILLLSINTDNLGAKILFEKSLRTSEIYPHLYAPLNINFVREVFLMKLNSRGEFIV